MRRFAMYKINKKFFVIMVILIIIITIGVTVLINTKVVSNRYSEQLKYSQEQQAQLNREVSNLSDDIGILKGQKYLLEMTLESIQKYK